MVFQSNITKAIFSPNQPWSWRHISIGNGNEFFSPIQFETIIFTSLLILQCALLHPRFQHSASARWTRLSLGPLTSTWWLCYPFRSAVQSAPNRDVFLGFLAAVAFFKSVEWSFATGPYHLRQLKVIDGTPTWEKEPTPKIQKEKLDWSELALWTTLLFTSQRGSNWSWGPPAKGNTRGFAKSVLKVICLQLVMLPCIAFVLCAQDHKNYRVDPTAALLGFGFRAFPGINLLAECLLSLAFMFLVSSSLEMLSMLMVLPRYILYPLAKASALPSKVIEPILNPVYYPQEFGNLFNLSSVSYFWGKSWHQKFRRSFLFCGGKPAMSLANYMGASGSVQKICGVMGVFALSGLFHEYPFYAYQADPTLHPRALFKTFPGTFLFFFVQSFGVILEPFIIPRIPKILGGARLWTAFFLFLTAPLFTHDACRPGVFIENQVHPSQWTWLNFVVPVPFMAKLLRPTPIF